LVACAISIPCADNNVRAIGQGRLRSYIEGALNKASENESVFKAYDAAVQAIEGMAGDQQVRHRHELLNAITENYETQGGCLKVFAIAYL
jgi:hypothetical protein